MGINYRTTVIYGFRLDISDINKSVTKYDENTGEPKQVEVFSHNQAQVHGVVVAEDKDNSDAFCVWEEIEGLRIEKSGYEGGDYFLGVEVGKALGNGNWWCEVGSAMPKAVTAFSHKYGVEPSIYAVMSAG